MKSNLSIIRVFRRQTDGKTYVITAPHPVTKNEAWSFTDQQLEFLADSAGITPAMLRLVAAGCTLVVEGAPVKAGDTMTNQRTGEVIKFTKDHFRVDRTSIVLSQQAQMTAAIAATVGASFAPAATNLATPAPKGADKLEKETIDEVFDETEQPHEGEKQPHEGEEQPDPAAADKQPAGDLPF